MLETPGALGFATRLDAEFKGWWFNGDESHEKSSRKQITQTKQIQDAF